MSEISRSLFSHQGAVIVQIALLAVGGWLMSYIAEAVGKAQLARLINMAAIMVAFGLVVGTIWSALSAVAKVLGL